MSTSRGRSASWASLPGRGYLRLDLDVHGVRGDLLEIGVRVRRVEVAGVEVHAEGVVLAPP